MSDIIVDMSEKMVFISFLLKMKYSHVGRLLIKRNHEYRILLTPAQPDTSIVGNRMGTPLTTIAIAAAASSSFISSCSHCVSFQHPVLLLLQPRQNDPSTSMFRIPLFVHRRSNAPTPRSNLLFFTRFPSQCSHWLQMYYEIFTFVTLTTL